MNEKIKKPLKKKIFTVCGVIVVLVLVSISIVKFMDNDDMRKKIVTHQHVVYAEELTQILEESSELTSAKIQTTGIVEYVDDGVKYVNRADFTMMFKATVRAGIDLEEIEITVNEPEKTVDVVIPKSRVLETTIGPESIKYFDTKFSIFNPNEKEDATTAMTLAKKKAEEEAPDTGILELADTNNKNLIRSLLTEITTKRDYSLNIKIGD